MARENTARSIWKVLTKKTLKELDEEMGAFHH